MRSINKVILIGRLGKDPEVHYLDNNVPLAKFTLATGETYVDRNTNEKREETQWHNVILWRGLAEVAEKYLKKGKLIYLEGKLTHRSYEGPDGQMRYFTEVVGRDLVMLESRSESNYVPPPVPPQYANTNSNSNNPSATATGEDNTQAAPATDSGAATDPEDDLPF